MCLRRPAGGGQEAIRAVDDFSGGRRGASRPVRLPGPENSRRLSSDRDAGCNTDADLRDAHDPPAAAHNDCGSTTADNGNNGSTATTGVSTGCPGSGTSRRVLRTGGRRRTHRKGDDHGVRAGLGWTKSLASRLTRILGEVSSALLQSHARLGQHRLGRGAGGPLRRVVNSVPPVSHGRA